MIIGTLVGYISQEVVELQVNLDFRSESDMIRKFRAGLALQPVCSYPSSKTCSLFNRVSLTVFVPIRLQQQYLPTHLSLKENQMVISACEGVSLF